MNGSRYPEPSFDAILQWGYDEDMLFEEQDEDLMLANVESLRLRNSTAHVPGQALHSSVGAGVAGRTFGYGSVRARLLKALPKLPPDLPMRG